MCCIANDEISSWHFNNNVNCNVPSGLVHILCSADNKNHLIHTFETLPNFPPESCMEEEENERVQDMAEN